MSNPAVLGMIRVTKTYEALANQLRERIISGSIPPGALLPNERKLGEQTGLSRGSVREALRVLEAQGLVETRLGRNGGRVAQRPDTHGISQSLDYFVRGQQVEFKALRETAEAIEPALAALAATHRTGADIEALQHASQELMGAGSDPAQFNLANSAWHLVVASASHNPMLIAIMHSLGTLLHDPHVDDFTSASIREEVVRIHARIEAAIVAGDVDAARRRMARHVKAYGTRVIAVAPKTVTLD